MKRFLLFDSGCSLCADLAASVVRETKGWLEARSLRDPEVQQLLDKACPGWRWEPMLLETDSHRTRAFAGFRMRARLTTGLGPVCAWRVANLVAKAVGPSSQVNLSRRSLLQRGGALVAGIAVLGLPRTEIWYKTPPASGPSVQLPLGAEEYGGFLLLPSGTPIPPYVKPSRLGVPVACGVGEGRGGAKATAATKVLSRPLDVVRESGLALYAPTKLPNGLRFATGYVIKHSTGEIFAGAINYDSFDTKTGSWQNAASVWAEQDFPKPFPLWSSEPVEAGGPAVVLEKANFLPSPGIMVSTQRGYVFHWIHASTLFALKVEYTRSNQEARLLAESLAPVV